MMNIYKTLELVIDKIDSNNNNRYDVNMAKLEYYYYQLIKGCPGDEHECFKLNVPTICTYITNVNKKLNITNVLKELYQTIDKNILNNIENDIFVITFKNYYNCDPFEFNFTYDLIKATEEYLKYNTNDIFFIHQVCENTDREIIEINIYCYQNNVHKMGIISNNKIFNAIDLDMLYIDKMIKL